MGHADVLRSVLCIPNELLRQEMLGIEMQIAEQALAMLKTVYLREGPDAAVRSAKYMVEAAAIVIAEELGPAETRRFLHIVGVKQGQEH